jgi:hypothetical protein
MHLRNFSDDTIIESDESSSTRLSTSKSLGSWNKTVVSLNIKLKSHSNTRIFLSGLIRSFENSMNRYGHRIKSSKMN